MGETAVLVKVCGMHRVKDAVLAAELGASAVGFIFWPGSPRFIDPATARTIAAALPPTVARVGVFVDQAPEFVKQVAERVPLDAVQLHGNEASEDYARLGVPLIKAIAVSDPFDATLIDAVPEDVTIMLDAHDPERRGGTGRTIDWSVAAAMAARRRTILSGGLNPRNVSEAVDRVRPYMVDVSSGVESAPGVKDPTKLRAFFRALAPDGQLPGDSE
jgi:phosphoribosylanthranilate isomerase